MIQKVNMKNEKKKKKNNITSKWSGKINNKHIHDNKNTQLSLVYVSNYYSQRLKRIIIHQITLFSIASRNLTKNQLKMKKTTNPIFAT
jgi:hypothetical protein